jgi:hypothetical protein
LAFSLAEEKTPPTLIDFLTLPELVDFCLLFTRVADSRICTFDTVFGTDLTLVTMNILHLGKPFLTHLTTIIILALRTILHTRPAYISPVKFNSKLPVWAVFFFEELLSPDEKRCREGAF